MSQNNKKSSFISNKYLALTAFVGIGCIAISLLLSLIFEGRVELAGAFKAVGQSIAYIICILVAYNWVATHKQIGWIISYVVFVVVIIVLFILTI